MEDVKDKVDRLERELSELKPSLRERIEKLEKKPVPPSSADRLWGLAEKAITPVAIMVLGFVLVDSVELAMKRQQLQLSAAREIQDLVTQIDTGERAKAKSAAVTLAAFGDFAAVPLARALIDAESVSAEAAEAGLRSLALSGSPAACEVLERMLGNRTKLYDWQTHASAARLLGDLECQEARRELIRIRNLLDGDNAIEEYGALVSSEVHKDDLAQLRRAVALSLTQLEAAR